MAFFPILFALTCTCISYAAAHSSPAASECDFTGIDVESAITELIAKFPESDFIGPEKYYPVFAGLEISGFNASGFHKLQKFGPVIPYCSNGTRMLQVDFINTGDVVIRTPWRHCSGHQGTLGVSSELSRFTVQLRVGLGEDNKDVKLSYEGPIVPVISENVRISLDGAGPNVDKMLTALATAFPAVSSVIWDQQFYYSLIRALYRAHE